MWRNGGHGGSRQKGDGDRYCDMRGTGSGETLKKSRLNESIHLNFIDDYVWMEKDGNLTLYGNFHEPPYWLHYGQIFSPGGFLMTQRVRKDIHLADSE